MTDDHVELLMARKTYAEARKDALLSVADEIGSSPMSENDRMALNFHTHDAAVLATFKAGMAYALRDHIEQIEALKNEIRQIKQGRQTWPFGQERPGEPPADSHGNG